MERGIGIKMFFSFTKKWGLSTEKILIACHLGLRSSRPPRDCWRYSFCCARTSRLRSSVCRAITSARFGGDGGGGWEPLAWSGLNPSGVPRVAPTIWKTWKMSITPGYPCFHFQNIPHRRKHIKIVQQIDRSIDNWTRTRVIDHNWWSVYYILVIYQLPFTHTYSCHL
jgi:hypothetical protein